MARSKGFLGVDWLDEVLIAFSRRQKKYSTSRLTARTFKAAVERAFGSTWVTIYVTSSDEGRALLLNPTSERGKRTLEQRFQRLHAYLRRTADAKKAATFFVVGTGGSKTGSHASNRHRRT
jgi:hypothetical protein